MTISLPIDDHLEEIVGALQQHNNLVLVAPPGAGKTTRVPPTLLKAGISQQKIVMLQPRRVAARAAADRIATEQDWRVGAEVGYQVRFERRIGKNTRLEIITEGLLTRRLQHDPLLEDVDLVILDEFHERSLHADLGLALLREVQQARPDLKLLVMSATLAAEPVASFLDAPTIRTEGRTFPVAISYLKQPRRKPLAELTTEQIKTVVEAMNSGKEPPGNVLVFLPGVGAIRRTASLLRDLEAEVLPLYGSLSAAEQDRALRGANSGRVVLATNVAETSVTVEGVTVVIDSGLARIPRYDARTGIDRLEAVPISKASAAQRAGRAGRTAPGRVIRLWTEPEQASRPEQTSPEIRRVDLSQVLLQVHDWGSSAESFNWFEAPPPGTVAQVLDLLQQLGALTPSGRPTELGRRMLQLPLHPRLARIVLAGEECGLVAEAATLVALIEERDIFARDATSQQSGPSIQPNSDSDLLWRFDCFDHWTQTRRPPRGSDAQAMRTVQRAREQLLRLIKTERSDPRPAPAAAQNKQEALLQLILSGYPDRVVQQREGSGHPIRGQLVGGRGVVLDQKSVVRTPLFVAIEIEDRGTSESLVRQASRIDERWLETTTAREHQFDEATLTVVAADVIRYRDLTLSTRPATPDQEQAANILVATASKDPRSALKPTAAVDQLIARASCLAQWLPQVNLPRWNDAFLAGLLPQLCQGQRSFADLQRLDLASWLRGTLDHQQLKRLDELAPAAIGVPSGRHLPLHYEQGAAPILAVPLQEMFGLQETPTVAGGKVAVLLHLLAPNKRPAQVTSDLRSFWQNTYLEVRKDLRARYPKHAWPEDPLTCPPQRLGRRRR